MKHKWNMAAVAALANGDLENAVIASTPGGIEAQEAAGQQAFVASTTLPRECSGCTREQLESLGFQFGADVDDIFCEATLPEGWTKRPTDHAMWSEIVDGEDQVRALVFYKAAFYDRHAHISLR